MAVVSNKGVPHKPLEETGCCYNCNTRLVREWKGKPLALCTKDELTEALNFLFSFHRVELLDPASKDEIRTLIVAADDPAKWRSCTFGRAEGVWLVNYGGIQGFIFDKDIPVEATTLFVEVGVRGESYGKLQVYTNVDAHKHTHRNWRIVGKLEL